MGKSLDPKKIKSAQRVLEVLEFFTRDRQECTVMDIAREYGYPQSSTSELLSCLVALGYLRRDVWSRTYKPTARAAMIGAWVQPRRFRTGRVAAMMDELAVETGSNIFLASQVGVGIQVAHSVVGDPGDKRFSVGSLHLLLHSAPGKALLSTACINSVKKLVHRMNAEADESHRVRADEFLAELTSIRTRGYAVSRHDDYAMVSIQLPTSVDEESLALTAVLPLGALEDRTEHIVQILRGGVARAFGGRDVSAAPKSASGVMGRAV